MLINVGGSIFVEAKISDPSRVTRSIGSGVRIEQSVDDAKAAVQEQISGLEKQHETLAEEYQKLIARIQVLNSQFQQLAAQVQGQGVAPPSQEE